MKETQELFNYFANEHDIGLLESDLQEVINIVNRINEAKSRNGVFHANCSGCSIFEKYKEDNDSPF